MRHALVINVSAPHFNLGAAKLASWLSSEGWQVQQDTDGPGLFAPDYDLVALSVIFSHHAPKAAQIARDVAHCCEVWCGGPGMAMLAGWWRRETGLECCTRLDDRFERERGPWPFTFASRGCPVGCYFCIVPRIEGKTFTLDWDFHPAPVLCDNNLSALPVEFQDHIIRRYQETGVPLKDANSGFEPRAFDGGTYERWKPILRGPWRYAYDELAEGEDVRRVCGLLKAEIARRKRVYVLVGNEPVAACYERARQVVEWGAEPFCQFIRPLDWLGGPLKYRFDWTELKARDFCRYWNTWGWRSYPIWEYANRQGEAPLFRELQRPFVSLAMAQEGGICAERETVW